MLFGPVAAFPLRVRTETRGLPSGFPRLPADHVVSGGRIGGVVGVTTTSSDGSVTGGGGLTGGLVGSIGTGSRLSVRLIPFRLSEVVGIAPPFRPMARK